MQISMIVAMARGRVIGYQNAMPWHLPADLRHFKTTTWGKPMVMGRKTFDSLGKPLPGRRHIVLTRQPDWSVPGVTVVDSLPAAWQACAGEEEVMVVGGAEIYSAALSQASRLYITEIDADFPGDTWFPERSDQDWQCVSRVPGIVDEQHVHPHYFCVYERIRISETAS